jgi:hypothetical protein
VSTRLRRRAVLRDVMCHLDHLGLGLRGRGVAGLIGLPRAGGPELPRQQPHMVGIVSDDLMQRSGELRRADVPVTLCARRTDGRRT